MNKIYTLLILAALILPLFAPAQKVRETMLKKGKERIPGYTIKLKHGKSLTNSILKETLKEAGLKKAKHKKGYFVYKGAILPLVSNAKQDYYYKVTGNKRKATIHFAVSKGYDNYITSANDQHTSAGINSFLIDVDSKITTREQIDEKQAELDEIEKEKAKKHAEIDKLQKGK